MEIESVDEVIFFQDDFAVKSFDAFDDMRRNEQLVDFRFTFENRCVSVHRLVLAARIPCFREIFSSCEAGLFFKEIESSAFESIINFAYTGKIKITTGNVTSLLSGSKALQVTPVYDACWEFLERRLHSNNVLSIRRLAEDYGCSKVLEAADKYLGQHFEELTNSEIFLDFSFQQLKAVISRHDIKASTEEKVFEAVIRWVKRCPSERRDLLPELLRCVRMYFMAPDYLIERVATEELVRSSLPCRDLVEEAKNYQLLPNKRSKFCSLPPRPRWLDTRLQDTFSPPDAKLDVMCCPSHDGNHFRDLLHAAYESEGKLQLKLFDPMNETWLMLSASDSSFLRPPHLVASVDEVLYIFTTYRVYTFNVNTRVWSSSVLIDPIGGSGSVSYKGKIYFFGGDGCNSSKVRCFDPKQTVLLDMCNTTRCIKYVGLAVVSTSKSDWSASEVPIYVTGGLSDGFHTYDDVERFTPQSKQWTKLSPMYSPRYSHGCCDLNGKVYVCGGMGNKIERLNSAEVYDPVTNRWNVISSLKKLAYFTSLISYEGRFYGHGFRMEIYDPKKNEWKEGNQICKWHCSDNILLAKSRVTADIYERILKHTRIAQL